ncbi:MAG TPA: DUF456 domain-containing protein [Dermacoccus sp.]|nr:DUF456 domain-containing protein [Dermacoccus sp.]
MVSTETLTTLGAALLVAVGIAGLIVPVLPGLACVVLGVLVWAIGQSSTAAWVVFAVACVLAVAGYVVQVLVPGRQLSRGGVARRSNIVGLVCAVVGVFVVPVIGLLLGFVIGVFLAESARLRDRTQAWAATRVAIRAALTSVGIELAAAVTIAVGWAIAAFVLAR